MTRWFWFARGCLAALCGLGLFVGGAAAQQPMPKQIRGFKGKLAQPLPDGSGIAVTDPTKNNAIAVVKIGPSTKLTVEGTADLSYLGPGVAIDFNAEMNRVGKVEGEIDKLTVCEIDQTDTPVVEPEDVTQPLPKDRNAMAKMHVRGTIRSIKNGLMLVQAPGVSVKAKLAASPTIKVAVHNPSWAQPGDPVLVDGQEIAPGQTAQAGQPDQPQQIYGTVVTITMEKPLEGKKKAVPTRKRAAGS